MYCDRMLRDWTVSMCHSHSQHLARLLSARTFDERVAPLVAISNPQCCTEAVLQSYIKQSLHLVSCCNHNLQRLSDFIGSRYLVQ